MLEKETSEAQDQRFQLNIQTHEVLMRGLKRTASSPGGSSLELPDPVFPRYPDLLGDVEPDPNFLPSNGRPYRTRITPFILRRALRGWLYPYVRSRTLPGEFHPIISYLFTEWKCNLDQLRNLKRDCQPHCFSTLNHNLAYCYQTSRAIKWMLKQAIRGFRGTTGSFDD